MSQAPESIPSQTPDGYTDLRSTLMAEAKKTFSHLLGLDPAEVDEDVSFIQLGAESLALLQFSQALQRSLGVKVHFRSLIEEFVTLGELAQHLETIVPAPRREVVPAAAPRPLAPAVAAAAPPPAAPVERTPVSRVAPAPPAITAPPVALTEMRWEPAAVTEGGPLAALLDRQLQLMDLQLRVTAQQLELLGRAGAVTDTMDVPVQEAPMADPPRSVASPPAAAEPLPVAAEPETTARTTEGRLKPAPFVAHQPAQVRRSSMSETQERHLRGLVERLESKARGSKRLTQDYRRYLADNRTAIAFRLAIKELLYPIFVDHAQGSRVWDIDGNEYIDVTMGFGTLIFGHSPEFVVEALKRQSERGLGIGLEPPLSGPAARLICELTGNDRASFVNDGTEAVKSAVRLARTLTGRTKIAMFQGAYHGWFDDVMAISRRGGDGQLVTLPMAPGVSPHVAENVLVLDYCSPESIEILERRGHELAAVVVDPQQSRRPGAFDNTQSFLHDIRRVTLAAGAAMILDEVVTGFRIRPGGAQEFYDVRADLVAYGKAAGAGLPIGVVSGKAEYMDGIDGGHWSYGDSSYPRADQTFIQGSYFKHPLVTPAIFEVLRHFQESGPSLQEELTGKMERLGRRIREHLEREGLPIEFLHWGSLANFIFGPEVKYPSVFFYHLLERGVYVRDARPWFLSTAHTERDLDELVEAVKASTAAMQAGGFLPRRGETRSNERQERDAATIPTAAVPVL